MRVARAGRVRLAATRDGAITYTGCHEAKTSATLSEDIVTSLDRASKKNENRSQSIERLTREGLAARARQAADARDLARINANAEALNAEAGDVLTYQGAR